MSQPASQPTIKSNELPYRVKTKEAKTKDIKTNYTILLRKKSDVRKAGNRRRVANYIQYSIPISYQWLKKRVVYMGLKNGEVIWRVVVVC